MIPGDRNSLTRDLKNLIKKCFELKVRILVISNAILTLKQEDKQKNRIKKGGERKL